MSIQTMIQISSSKCKKMDLIGYTSIDKFKKKLDEKFYKL